MEIQAITNRCFGLFMRRNVSISRNRTKIERLLDWKEFPSKSVGRFSVQCLTGNSYTMGCPPVCGDNSQALASGLSNVEDDKHGIII